MLAARYIPFLFSFFLAIFFTYLIFYSYHWFFFSASIFFWLLFFFALSDFFSPRHALLRNYPLIGHLRFWSESFRPEIRQYFMESDEEARPFSRSQRNLVYQRAKGSNDERGFGTSLNLYESEYYWLNHSVTPSELVCSDFRVKVGRDTEKFYLSSILNVSAMSFGALSAEAVQALNFGAQLGNFAQNTGEGGISPYHLKGGDLIWQIGTGYFGCRDTRGFFDSKRFSDLASLKQVKMIEVKLSQGAKPGRGGFLPKAKVTAEIARIRGVSIGENCISPSSHTAFSSPLEFLVFLEKLKTLSGGKPVGFKLCVGHPWEFFSIAKAMLVTGIYPDFVVVDGAEGGTGAAQAEFVDHVGTPLYDGLRLVHNTLVGINARCRVKLCASGKVISAFDIFRLIALGADWCNSARGFMFSLGCIQAKTCHTGCCPTGITTQNTFRRRGLVVNEKSIRVYNFHRNTLKALSGLISAVGVDKPEKLSTSHVMHRVLGRAVPLSEIYPELSPGFLLDGLFDKKPEWDSFRSYWLRAVPESFSLP